MDGTLLELEATLAAMFDTDDWALDAELVAQEVRRGVTEERVREISMDLVPLGGSRPRAD